MALKNILVPSHQVTTAAGKPLAGGLVYLYEPGTTTFVTSFRDSGLVTPHTNPVKLSGSGRANIWITRDVDMFIRTRDDANLVIEELNANPDSLGFDEAGGLVPNGSFEIDSDADLVPDGYTLASEAGATNELDTSESTDGAQSFRFTSSGNGGGSLVTDDFFPVNDADSLRVNVDLRSTVANVRNIVRVEWYDVSQILISNSDAYDSTANPTTYTTQNLVVAPPALARFAKIRLIGIDPTVLLAGSTYFDRLSVFYPAVVTGVFDNITIQNNEIITTNLNGDLNLRPDGTGSVVIDYNGNPVFESEASSVRIRADINTATPPTTESVTGGYEIWDADGTDQLGRVGFTGSNDLRLTNNMHGGSVVIEAEDSGGVLRNLIESDPGGQTSLYGAGNKKIETRSTGQSVFGNMVTATPPTTEAVHSKTIYYDQDGTEVLGVVGLSGSNTFEVYNFMHGGTVNLKGQTSAAGTVRTLLQGDPDADVKLYQAGTEVARTETSANGGFEVNNTSTGSGFERVLTESDHTPSETMITTSTQSVSSSTTFTDDAQLQGFVLEANTSYIIDGSLNIVMNAASMGVKIRMNVASGGIDLNNDIVSGILIADAQTPEGYSSQAVSNGVVFTGWNGGVTQLNFSQHVETTGSGATLDFQWAQQTSNGSNLTMYAGSWIRATKVA